MEVNLFLGEGLLAASTSEASQYEQPALSGNLIITQRIINIERSRQVGYFTK